MGTFITTAMIGLSLGAQYALLALGFSLIFGILGVVNFAHGAFYVVGGYAAYAAVTFLGVPYVVAVVLATLVTGVIGFLFELFFIQRVIDDGLATLMLTLGLAMILVTGVVAGFGPESPLFAFPVTSVLTFGSVRIPASNLICVAVTACVVACLWLLMFRTGFGRALRAMANDREIAATLGLRARLMFPLAFAIATALAGLTGALVTPILSLAPHVGDPVLATSFIVVILGGMGSLWGATAAAVIVGLIEAYSSVYLGGSEGALALFVLVLVMLLIKPSGLFGREARGA